MAAFRIGSKVTYKHGFGESVGRIVHLNTDEGKAVIETEKGKQVIRPIGRLSRAASPSANGKAPRRRKDALARTEAPQTATVEDGVLV